MSAEPRNGSDPHMLLPVVVDATPARWWDPPFGAKVCRLIVDIAAACSIVGLSPVGGLLSKILAAVVLVANRYGYGVAFNYNPNQGGPK